MSTTNMNFLPRSAPEVQGISSAAIARFVDTVEATIDSLHSFMLLRHGFVVAEGWWRPWKSERPHMLFSLSKSFASTAVGLAVAEGRLSLDDPLLDFFPKSAPKVISRNLEAMQIQHLLSMSTGHHLDTTERIMRSRDPVKKFLSLHVRHYPGTYFVYNSGATYMLAAIVQQLTGQTLVKYLTPRLFEPLGISGAAWDTHPNGVNFGFSGLNIKTEDIARFGQLYLQRGRWLGRQLLPEAWVDAATSKQVSNENEPNIDWRQGYGFQFWRSRYNTYRGDGAFGQFCLVMPEQEAVLAITSGVSDMQDVLNAVWDKLLPAFGAERLPADPAAVQDLALRLQNLALAPPQGSPTSKKAAEVSGKTYTFEPNLQKLHSLRFDFYQGSCTMTYAMGGGKGRRGVHRLAVNYGSWTEGLASLDLERIGLLPVAASGVWTAEDTFVLTVCEIETPYVLTLAFRFEGEKVFYDFKRNVSFGPTELLQLVGVG